MDKEITHFDTNTKYFLGTGWFLLVLSIVSCEYHGII